MKKIILIILLIPFKISLSQESNNLQRQLDSLVLLKADYEKKILNMNLLIKEIEDKIALSKFEQLETYKYVVPSEPIIRIRDKENSSGTVIAQPKQKEIIELIDFNGITDYWFVSYNKIVGYVNEVLIKQNSDIDNFKKYLIARKTQIEKQKAKEAEERLNAEIQKKEEKRNLEAQKLVEEAKRKSEEEQKLFEERKKIREQEYENWKANIIKKYGSDIANKIISGKIWLGMTDQMATDSWGVPDKKNRSVGSWGVHEQWIYENQGTYLYFENGKLTSWQN